VEIENLPPPLNQLGLDVAIQDTPFDPDVDPNNRVIRYKPEGSEKIYQIFVYLTGKDLSFVKRAVYALPPFFEQRIIKVDRSISNPNCKLVVNTSKKFTINVWIEHFKGNLIQLNHRLEYDKFFLPAVYNGLHLSSAQITSAGEILRKFGPNTNRPNK